MNKIMSLLDKDYVRELFRREVLPQYPEFCALEDITIKPYKELTWTTTYHVVIGYQVGLRRPDGSGRVLPIVCTAHSSEDRENVYLGLSYLWEQGLPDSAIDLPRPLFYSPEFRGTFYRGLEGDNLFQYIQRADIKAIEGIVSGAGHIFASLHALPAPPHANFNPRNSRMETVIPGRGMILQEMSRRYGNRYNPDLGSLYAYFDEQEERYWGEGRALSLIHGDAHPENVLRTGPERVGLIDFTDLCLADPARDIGSFLQQLQYRIGSKLGDPAYTEKIKDLFLVSYFASSPEELDEDWRARIRVYYYWTMVRTATYFFLKYEPDENRAVKLLAEAKAVFNSDL